LLPRQSPAEVLLPQISLRTLVIDKSDVQYDRNSATSAEARGIMDELIGRLAANVGVDRNAAEKSVGIILNFLRKEGPPEKVQALIDRLPGAEGLLATHSGAGGGGFPMGGIMGAGTKMMAVGLSIGQVQGITRETIAYAREKIGDEAVGEIVGAIPGLSQFV
jgi:hypothetical protein